MTSIASPEISPNVAEDSTTTIRLPVVNHGVENKGVLSFTLENTNVSIANALRRVLLSDIEAVVFDTDNDKINVYENTTRFHNEILKQRLGCIPIHIKDIDSIENLIIELNINNESDSIQYVTSKDFTIKDITTDKYLTTEQTKSIFPPNNITKEYVLFTRLRPKISNDILGETISLKVKLKTATAKQDGMYNVVSTCAFGNTEDKVEQHNQWQSISEDLESKGLNGDRIEYERKNWYTLQAKRHFIQDSFDFKVESVGVYANVELINMGCDNIIKRLDKIKEKCDKEQLKLNKKATAMENAVDVILQGEDYTIGKVIEFVLHEQYYKKDQALSYVGFIKKHPHDDYSIIRMAFSSEGDTSLTDVNVYSMVKFSCDVGIKLFANIKEYF
jgi:DNA-directed RNA polymerase subunit L